MKAPLHIPPRTAARSQGIAKEARERTSIARHRSPHVRVVLIMLRCTFSKVSFPLRFFEVRAITCRETMKAKHSNNRGGTPRKDRVNAVTYTRWLKSLRSGPGLLNIFVLSNVRCLSFSFFHPALSICHLSRRSSPASLWSLLQFSKIFFQGTGLKF